MARKHLRLACVLIVTATLAGLLLQACSSKPDGPSLTLVTRSVPQAVSQEQPWAETPLPGQGKLQVVEGQIDYQVGNKKNERVSSGGEVPVGKDVRLFTFDQQTTLRLEDGTVLTLLPNTTLNSIVEASGQMPAVVNMERGSILVEGSNARIESRDSQLWAASKGAKAGVTYDPISNVFTLDCFGASGACELNGYAGFQEVPVGTRLGYRDNALSDASGADYVLWAVTGKIPAPTATPEPTATMTATATDVPEVATPVPTAGTTDAPDADPKKPVKPDPDFGGG